MWIGLHIYMSITAQCFIISLPLVFKNKKLPFYLKQWLILLDSNLVHGKGNCNWDKEHRGHEVWMPWLAFREPVSNLLPTTTRIVVDVNHYPAFNAYPLNRIYSGNNDLPGFQGPIIKAGIFETQKIDGSYSDSIYCYIQLGCNEIPS